MNLGIVPTIECTNPHALIELVKQNDGFTILPYSLVKEANEVSYLKSNDFQIQRTYHIVMHKDKKLLPLYQEIFELIKKGIMTKNHYSFYYLALIAQRIFVDLALEFR